jgi:hypothetical protein
MSHVLDWKGAKRPVRAQHEIHLQLFALANLVSDIAPSKTPLRSIHPPGGTWLHHHPAAAQAAASALRAHALRAALRATFC